MALNIVHEIGDQLDIVVSHPAAPESGQPVRWGELVGVALADEDTATGKTPVKFNGTAELSVKGVNGGGNSAVADGDQLFYVDADTPPISKKNTGRLVGQAMATVGSGATATILVRLNG
ncbi:hypothetical protein GCM10023170_010990 [Phytohabitans houttuyneae]|uniref:capsid cement protein n=1 Tax=Phytohabitans houttuyneae TaxID=1076126 RepID=UPI0031F0DB62